MRDRGYEIGDPHELPGQDEWAAQYAPMGGLGAAPMHGYGATAFEAMRDALRQVEAQAPQPGACRSCGKPRCGSCGAPLPWVAEADDATYGQVVETSDVPVLLDLWAPWCGPCRMVSPALERLARRYAGALKLVKINVDEAKQVAQRFEVQGVPTLVVLDRGQVLARQTGAAPEAALAQWLKQALPKTS